MKQKATEPQPLGLNSCEFCGIGRLCLSTSLLGGDLQPLKPIVKRRFLVPKGQAVFIAGQRMSGLFVVRSGSFKTVMVDQSGQERVIDFVLPGDVLGLEDAELKSHTLDAVALEDSWICELPLAALRERVYGDAELSREIFSSACRKVHHQRRRLYQLGGVDAAHRVANFLLDLSQRLSERRLRAERLRLSMDRRDIASYLGMTLETVSRTFSSLQKEGLIRVHGKSVDLLDVERLHQDYACAAAA